jgi:hypothetical protein
MRENARDDYHIMRDKVLTLERGRNGNNDSRSSKIQDSAAGNSQRHMANKDLYEERWPKLRLANGRLFEAQQFGEGVFVIQRHT